MKQNGKAAYHIQSNPINPINPSTNPIKSMSIYFCAECEKGLDRHDLVQVLWEALALSQTVTDDARRTNP